LTTRKCNPPFNKKRLPKSPDYPKYFKYFFWLKGSNLRSETNTKGKKEKNIGHKTVNIQEAILDFHGTYGKIDRPNARLDLASFVHALYEVYIHL